MGRVFRSAETPKCLILALERKIVDASEEGATDDYRIIRSKVEKAKCEVFYLQPSEIWGDDKLRLHPGWEEEQPNHKNYNNTESALGIVTPWGGAVAPLQERRGRTGCARGALPI